MGRLRVEGNLHQWRKVPAEDGEINRRVTGKVRSNNYQLPWKRQAKQDKGIPSKQFRRDCSFLTGEMKPFEFAFALDSKFGGNRSSGRTNV